MKSQEKEITENALRMSARNIFDQLGQSRGEDMCTHLEARHTSATFRRREDLPVVSSINAKINDLRARLKNLMARNTEAAQSTSTSPVGTTTY